MKSENSDFLVNRNLCMYYNGKKYIHHPTWVLVIQNISVFKNMWNLVEYELLVILNLGIETNILPKKIGDGKLTFFLL